MSIQIGDTVHTPHGLGYVVGFERFDEDGWTAPMGDSWNGNERILCNLDDPREWPFDGLYALFPHEYKELNNA